VGYTLAEAENYSNDALLAGIVECLISESPVLQVLPFESFQGNAYAYNRETTLPTVSFYDPGEVWQESTPVVTKVTAKLKILGGDVDVDKFLRTTRLNINDIAVSAVMQKAKAVQRTFEDRFIYGVAATEPKAFDGVHVMCGTGQTINISADAVADPGTFTALEQMIDLVRPGKPDLLMMSRRTRRAINAGARTLGGGNAFVAGPGALGPQTLSYQGIPVAICDYMVDTELLTAGGLYSAKTGGASSSIFGLKFGLENYGLIGLEPEGGGLQVEPVGILETKDADRERVKWYMTLAMLSNVCIARLTGLSAVAFTT